MVACMLASLLRVSPQHTPAHRLGGAPGAYAHRVPTLARERPRLKGRKSPACPRGPWPPRVTRSSEHRLPSGSDAFRERTYQNWSGQPLTHGVATSRPCPTGMAVTSRPTTAEGEDIPWLPDVSVSRSSAMGFPPSCPT